MESTLLRLTDMVQNISVVSQRTAVAATQEQVWTEFTVNREYCNKIHSGLNNLFMLIFLQIGYFFSNHIKKSYFSFNLWWLCKKSKAILQNSICLSCYKLLKKLFFTKIKCACVNGQEKQYNFCRSRVKWFFKWVFAYLIINKFKCVIVGKFGEIVTKTCFIK